MKEDSDSIVVQLNESLLVHTGIDIPEYVG